MWLSSLSIHEVQNVQHRDALTYGILHATWRKLLKTSRRIIAVKWYGLHSFSRNAPSERHIMIQHSSAFLFQASGGYPPSSGSGQGYSSNPPPVMMAPTGYAVKLYSIPLKSSLLYYKISLGLGKREG